MLGLELMLTGAYHLYCCIYIHIRHCSRCCRVSFESLPHGITCLLHFSFCMDRCGLIGLQTDSGMSETQSLA